MYKEADPGDLKKRQQAAKLKKDAATYEYLKEVLDGYKALAEALEACFEATESSADVLEDDISDNITELAHKLKWSPAEKKLSGRMLLDFNRGLASSMETMHVTVLEAHKRVTRIYQVLEPELLELHKRLSDADLDKEIDRAEDQEDPDADLNEDQPKPSLLDRAKNLFKR